MSLPRIPNMNPNITVTREDAITMILMSIAMESIGLSHIINAEGEKMQYLLGTLVDTNGNIIPGPEGVTVDDVLGVSKSVVAGLNSVLRNEALLQVKLEDVIELESLTTLP